MNYTSNDTQCCPFKLFCVLKLIFSTVLFISVQLSDNLLSLVPTLPFTKDEVLLTCQEGKNLLMSHLLRTYNRYDHETLKSNINFFFLTQINIQLNRLEQEKPFFYNFSIENE